MQLHKVSLADSHAFSPFFLDYIQHKDVLKPFYGRFPELRNFSKQIEEKKSAFPQAAREALVNTLQRQYEGLPISPHVEENISLLADAKSFTVTTGHQLNIFTGPLYFVFKIITVINACRQLKTQYPGYNFIPVYWMASEDHDYEEIKYFNLYGKKHVWNTEQSGAVGRFHTEGLDKMANTIPGKPKIFREAYAKHKKLADAVRHYVNALFGAEGLVVVDADDRSLKSQFTSVMRQDILQHVNKKIVDTTNAGLEALGYKAQVFCRDINFFYLVDGLRSRIEKQGDQYHVLDSDLSFSADEIEKLIEGEPEKLSPNVILRPLYEEMILPNLAYVGGPAEVIYWLQLKEVFRHFNVPFPILMPRNFGMIIDHEITRKFLKTGLELRQLFEEKNELFNHWVLAHSTQNLSVVAEREGIDKIFEVLQKRAGSIDKSLTSFVAAEGKRALKSLEKVEYKLLRAEKRRHTDKLRQIETVKDVLFPGGKLQERTDNFLNFQQRDPEFISRLLNTLDPFDFQFNILSYTS
ncbi:MAG: bacillithiol biosynthesis cysteine-adding enzyme BshC [Cyclobacteriaceae bacterium]|nr:bacillithiol biosynthesis cysteine-adding enzyme BshC [Cyclobacteriaceae bacterium]